jgi:hypothetical protein
MRQKGEGRSEREMRKNREGQSERARDRSRVGREREEAGGRDMRETLLL